MKLKACPFLTFVSSKIFILIVVFQLLFLFCLLPQSKGASAMNDGEVFPGADEKTPSRAFYFDWISSQYEGSTEAQTLIKLDFFKWLHDEYGMVLDVYSLDVGNIDDGPFTAGVGRLIPDHWGTTGLSGIQTAVSQWV